MHITLRGTALVVLLLVSSLGHAAPKKPAKHDNGPSLAATMQFIQEKMNGQGDVFYVETVIHGGNVNNRGRYDSTLNVVADAATCTLRSTSTSNITIFEPQDGGQHQTVGMYNVSLIDIEKLTVENQDDQLNRVNADAGNPQITSTDVPAIFVLVVTSGKSAFTFHATSVDGNQSPRVEDSTTTTAKYIFRDEETANRVAKAMLHAVELCGGGSKDPF